MPKKLPSLLLLCLSWLYPAAYMHGAGATAQEAAKALSPQPDQSSVDQAVAYVLTHYHYSREPLDPALSGRIFDEYLKELDAGHDYFTQADVDSFGAYRANLAASIKQGDLAPAFAIYSVFRQRFDERMAYADGVLDKEPDLKSDESLPVGDNAGAWAADRQQLDDRWRKRLKNEVIDLMLNGNDWPKTSALLKRRYHTLAAAMAKVGSDEVFDSFMNAYAKALDPHTEYFAPVEYQQFKTQMSLKLEGIGVELQGDEDYVKIARVLSGSPAAKSGGLHAGDRIASVAQGDSDDFVDVAGWKLDDVVRLTRGPKGTVVRLKILPTGARPGGPQKVIRLVRDAIRLADEAARSDIISVPRKQGSARIGVIRVPEFYVDADARSEGKGDYNSVSRDVRKLLLGLEAKHVDGVILDIRNNGGGSVQEAADLAGLFIPRGPMVQLRSSDDHIDVVRSTTTPVYSGPLAVLVDRLSASASEIFAAAVQDYRRGVIIGTDTYGKGVATQFVDLGELVGGGEDAGQLMFVSDKFYRVTGASTQDRGVSPDIQLPSDINPKQFGEETEDNALPWDTVDGLDFTPVHGHLDAMLPELRKRHEQRAKGDPLYKLYLADIEHLKKEDAVTSLSLMLDVRKREEQREEAWRASDDVAWQRITGSPPQPADGAVANPQDAVLREGANIVADMTELQHG
ncbi:MAG TPA: carboxy terminal-processing peptidase [Gammaproteobacteria bacterium]|nr:carboxy terminal-processing peptidase [Gammaproteobacteria bacterium]